MNRILLFLFGGAATVGVMMYMSGHSSGALVWGIIAAVALGLWINFIPTWVAYNREHPNRVPILLVNIFLGWTFLGWVIALIWACFAIPESATQSQPPARGFADS